MSRYWSASRMDSQATSPLRTYRGMLLATVIVPLIGGLLVVLHGLSQPNSTAVMAFGLLVALAALIVGGLGGFLFGIPRALQRSDDASTGKPGYAVNTNLEQISDWLTKILVGVGLVQLGQVPHGIARLSNTLAPALGGASWSPIAAGVILVLFSTWGFFLGYLLTRTYLTAALRDFDGFQSEKAIVAIEEAETRLSSADLDPARSTKGLRPSPDSRVPPTHNREPLENPLPLPWFDNTGSLLSDCCREPAFPARVAGAGRTVRLTVRHCSGPCPTRRTGCSSRNRARAVVRDHGADGYRCKGPCLCRSCGQVVRIRGSEEVVPARKDRCGAFRGACSVGDRAGNPPAVDDVQRRDGRPWARAVG